ncbi:Diaminopimelate decarboxylase [Blattabacterium sp. (Nauphoeta cinerea)]|uniref:diaminopimelate decarboxylase n=1 Tax=Blattabacterium sp. (Nauphoeta cinerea) TaxID=1316444 RepID=UPI0003B07396|nr:diaminopimelate decarboxylase [Blattabacterium sp. (Nauphoeta cinerea)]AGW86085.1 Diaminopimelate decarboxylase [Blattabacterium sp. (Nauphoeta cinerea)]
MMHELENKRNSVQGEYLIQLAKKYGTPLYVYDSCKIRKQYMKMKKAFHGIKNLIINYACKANTNLNILKFLQKLGSGLDTVSIQEVELGLKAGFHPKSIIFTPNCVSIQEIKKAVDFGVRINLDNLSILEQFGESYPDYAIGIRINPHIMAGGNSKISVGHIDSKFGISHYQIPHIKRILKNTGLKIEGFHMHTGSDISDIKSFLSGAKILFQTASDFQNIDYIDFGSGFKVPYKENDVKTDINFLSSSITEKFEDFCKTYGSQITLILEPGKFIVSESGYFLVSVNVIKHTISTVFAGVNSGFNHFLRPMFYDAYHCIENISNPNGRFRFYTVVGYICESDTFGFNRKVREIREGDILCIKNAGAYCFSMSSNYNSRYRPSEVMIFKGKDFLIRKRETMQDLIRNIVHIHM